MTKIKLCGLSRPDDIKCVNTLLPEYIGFVFAASSRRYVSPKAAVELRKLLAPEITPVGVFVNEDIRVITDIANSGAIDIIQLHGAENSKYIKSLRLAVKCPIIKAFSVNTEKDIEAARSCSADYILLDSGNGGTGTQFDHKLIRNISRPYFLAGGLDSSNVGRAVTEYAPYAVDTSSALETNGIKDKNKMKAFVDAVRKGKDKYI